MHLDAYTPGLLPLADLTGWLTWSWQFLKVLIGFSLIIFVHELGHFLAAKWSGIRVDRFAIGFGTRLFGWRKGEGFTLGNRSDYSPEELAQKNYGETDYCFKALPLGGYVKMLGESDVEINEKTGEIKMSSDPRAFPNKSIGARMVVVSAGVIFNLLFAAIAFMAVFLVGLPMPAPVIGGVASEGPAANAGLRAGDRVLEINNWRVDAWHDIRQFEVLADQPIRVTIERDGKVMEPMLVKPEFSTSEKLQTIGVMPAMTTTVALDGPPVDEKEGPKAGDRITHVNGTPVRDAREIYSAMLRSHGRALELVVERPLKKNAFETRKVYARGSILIAPADSATKDRTAAIESRHILGLMQRCRVKEVSDGRPAKRAGFQPGDVIAQWGTIPNPTEVEVLDSIAANRDKPINVVVERDGKTETLTVTPEPERRFQLFGASKPIVGLVLADREERRAVVAKVAPNTPAAELGMPRGAEILAIGDRPVDGWFGVVEQLFAAAGSTVTVRFRTGEEEVVASLRVPSSVVDALGLPQDTEILDVDGIRNVVLDNGAEASISASTLALRKALSTRIGQTVTIRYVTGLVGGDVESGRFTVREDNLDAWQFRVQYVPQAIAFSPLIESVTAHGNPLRAMWMGVKVTYQNVMNVYQTMKQVAKQNVGTDSISGPVGIFSVAIQQAEAGFTRLLFFLAFLSVNLAVINFLPLPVVDGGLMVFLLIEKLRGKPLSIKTQMATTIAGLALIGLVFIYVTIQDITKLL